MEVSVSQFKAHLAKYLRAARQGRPVCITDRGEPVAKLVAIEPASSLSKLVLSQPRDPSAPPLGQLRVRSIRWRGPTTVELLRGDRDRR